MAIILPSPLTYARQRPITASHSSRHDMLAIISSQYQYGPFLFLLQKLCQITWLLTGWKKFSLLTEAPLRPVAFATWLIRHCSYHFTSNSTPIQITALFCSFSLYFSSIFPGGQLTPFAPMCGRPRLTVSNSSLFTPALLRTHSFVFFAVHETHRIFHFKGVNIG